MSVLGLLNPPGPEVEGAGRNRRFALTCPVEELSSASSADILPTMRSHQCAKLNHRAGGSGIHGESANWRIGASI